MCRVAAPASDSITAQIAQLRLLHKVQWLLQPAHMPIELPEGAEATAAIAEDAPGPAGADRYSLTLDCAHKLGQAVLGLLFNPLALEQATVDGCKAVVPPVAAHAGIPKKAGMKKRRSRSPSPTATTAAIGPADHQQEQQQQARKHKKRRKAKQPQENQQQ